MITKVDEYLEQGLVLLKLYAPAQDLGRGRTCMPIVCGVCAGVDAQQLPVGQQKKGCIHDLLSWEGELSYHMFTYSHK